MYVQDSRTLPWCPNGWPSDVSNNLKPIFESYYQNDLVLECPSDKGAPWNGWYNTYKSYGSSYIYNGPGYAGFNNGYHLSSIMLSKITSPSEKLMFSDDWGWWHWPDYPVTNAGDTRGGGGLFVDGHAKTIRDEVWDEAFAYPY